MTPLRKLLDQPSLIRFRRMLGLFAFFYGVPAFHHLRLALRVAGVAGRGEFGLDRSRRRYRQAAVHHRGIYRACSACCRWP